MKTLFVQAETAGVQYYFDGESYMSPELEGWKVSVDINKVSQIFRNLVSNALKFTKRGGSVFVRSTIIPPVIEASDHAKMRPTLLRVSVKDTGVGISKV